MTFLYWGRRGALSQFALEVGRAAQADPRVATTISVSRQNESYSEFEAFGPALFAIDTFRTNPGALLQAWRIPLLRRRFHERLRQDRTQAVIELMPHVWSPLVTPIIRAAGARYCTIIHDADAHPGDRTGSVQNWANRSALSADLVLTLSQSVAARLVASGKVQKERVVGLLHPELSYGPRHEHVPPAPGEPLRLLFLGRILPYKGLPLFLDTVDLLRASGVAVEVGVFGEGTLGPSAERLQRMGAEVVNRWLDNSEIAAILARFHVVVLSHTEASQSGVAAAAFGAGVPVIATPVGGLVEQVTDGVTGILAQRANPMALAEAVRRLLLDPVAYHTTCQNIARTRDQRSMAGFVEDCVAHALCTGQT